MVGTHFPDDRDVLESALQRMREAFEALQEGRMAPARAEEEFLAGYDEARDLLRTTDPRRVAIVEGQPAWTTPAAAPLAPVKVISYRPDRIELETNAARPAWLVAAESWAPDWRALVDGQAADLYPTNVAFQGLRLGAGQHRVTLEYVPRATYAAVAVSGLAWWCLAVWAIRRRKRER